jgi:CubicO group peptidase (beta-lactamase class C family)
LQQELTAGVNVETSDRNARLRGLACLMIVMTSIASLAAAHAAGTGPEPASSAALAQLDGHVAALSRTGSFSGVVLVARDGTVLFERAYGKRDARGVDLNTPDTRFNLASAGKMFTATAILQQVAAGRLTLDTAVGEVLKDFPNTEFARLVTVRQLLTHAAGAGDIDLFGVENAPNRQDVRTVAQMVELHGDRAPEFPPGSEQKYGNYGHVVLGRMVEVLSGDSFEAYVEHHVFRPLGMTRTGFVDCTDPAPDLAVGYVETGGQWRSNCETLPRRGFPAGGEVSTARDMFAFTEALRSGRLLPVPLFEEAIRPQREFMGLGFFATDYGPGHADRDFRWGHGGSADGICTDVRVYPRTGETIIVLSNTDPPACFEVAGFLHRQWGLEQGAREGNALPGSVGR